MLKITGKILIYGTCIFIKTKITQGNTKPLELERKYIFQEIKKVTHEIKEIGTYASFQTNLETERINQNRINYKNLK